MLFINNNKNQNKKVGILHRTYHPFFFGKPFSYAFYQTCDIELQMVGLSSAYHFVGGNL